jgi:hypothetical protein
MTVTLMCQNLRSPEHPCDAQNKRIHTRLFGVPQPSGSDSEEKVRAARAQQLALGDHAPIA